MWQPTVVGWWRHEHHSNNNKKKAAVSATLRSVHAQKRLVAQNVQKKQKQRMATVEREPKFRYFQESLRGNSRGGELNTTFYLSYAGAFLRHVFSLFRYFPSSRVISL